METITVSLDNRIAENARLFAKRQGISLTELIKEYLSHLQVKDTTYEEEEIPDVVLSLLGAGTPVEDDDINGRKAYHEHLTEKYK